MMVWTKGSIGKGDAVRETRVGEVSDVWDAEEVPGGKESDGRFVRIVWRDESGNTSEETLWSQDEGDVRRLERMDVRR